MMPVSFLGDSAVLIEVDGADLLARNARALAVAEAIRAQQVPGVHDVVPAMASVTVHVNPLTTDLTTLHMVIDRALSGGADLRTSEVSVVEVSVTYGGVDGPDLSEVAAATGCSEADVVARHSALEYRVCFLGFLPGFPYLGLVDEILRVPRRRTPRPLVRAGSVAIADRFCGIYPTDSPGGWHVIGRTSMVMFDVSAASPARLLPGDRVRFIRSGA